MYYSMMKADTRQKGKGMARFNLEKMSEEKMRRALDAIRAASEDGSLDDEAVYVYAVAALVSDDDWVFSEEGIIEAANDPIIGAMAEAAVRMVRK